MGGERGEERARGERDERDDQKNTFNGLIFSVLVIDFR